MNRRGFLALAALAPFARAIVALKPPPPKLNLSIRYIRQFDAVSCRYVDRFDVLYGYAMLRPDLACQIVD